MKLIIDIPEEIYQEAIKSGYSHLYDEAVANAVAEGIPLDSVKFHIEHMACKQYEHRLTLDRQEVIDVLDNFIGLEKEKA